MNRTIMQNNSIMLLSIVGFFVIGISGCDTKKAQQEKADNIITLAKSYADQNNYEKAIETYNQIFQIKHSDSYKQVSFEIAKIYMDQKKYGKALREIDIYASNFSDPESFILWIQAKMGSINPAEWKSPSSSAYKTIEKTAEYVKSNPDKVEVLRYLGVIYCCASDFDFSDKIGRAVEICCKAISLKPDDAEGYYFLSIAYSKDWKRLDQAEEACLKAIQLKPDYTDAYTLLGTIYWGQSRYRNHYYGVKYSFKDGKIYVENAKQGSAEETRKQAIEALLKSISIKPTAWAWFKLGEYSGDRNIGLDDLSLHAFKISAEMDPSNEIVHTLLGHAFSQKKQWAEAVKSYERALKIDPNSPGASTYIVVARKELDKQTPL